MANNWYYATGGQQHGPMSEERLKQLVRSGEVQGGDLVWREGMPQWTEAAQVRELQDADQQQAPQQQAPNVPPPQPQRAMPIGYYGPQIGYAQPAPPNYLVPAILTTLFCCLPFGIVSIVYAAQVNTKQQVGDYHGAVQSSNNARFWAWMAFGFGFAVMGVWLLLGVLSAGAGF